MLICSRFRVELDMDYKLAFDFLVKHSTELAYALSFLSISLVRARSKNS